MHSRAEQELPRTNNSAEGWHLRIQATLDCHHLNFWKLTKDLPKERGQQKVYRTQILAGHASDPDRKRYVDCN